MNCQIYQLQKSQALDLLNRVQTRICEFYGDDVDPFRTSLLDNASSEISDLYMKISELRTEFDVAQLSLADVAGAIAFFCRQNKLFSFTPESTAKWFAQYLSNQFPGNVTSQEFLLAAGFSLKPEDQLLRDEEEL